MTHIKSVAGFALALACYVLAGVLLFGGRKGAGNGSGRMALHPIPALVTEDLTVLDRPVPNLKITNMAFQDVVNMLIDKTHTNIVVDWQPLEELGVTRNRLVTVSIGKTTLSNALAIVLGSFKLVEPSRAPAFYLSNGIITITTAERAGQHSELAMFNIRGLVDELISHKTHPDPKPDTWTIDGPPPEDARERAIDQITKCIEESIVPESWRDNGGAVGSLSEMNGVLIVQQTSQNIRLISALLQQLQTTYRAEAGKYGTGEGGRGQAATDENGRRPQMK